MHLTECIASLYGLVALFVHDRRRSAFSLFRMHIIIKHGDESETCAQCTSSLYIIYHILQGLYIYIQVFMRHLGSIANPDPHGSDSA
jgi:hypothetical protein